MDLRTMPSDRLRYPRGQYANVIWLSDGTITVNYVAEPENVQRRMQALEIYRLRPDGTDMRAFPLIQLPACGWTTSSEHPTRWSARVLTQGAGKVTAAAPG